MFRFSLIAILLGSLCLAGCQRSNVAGNRRPFFNWGNSGSTNSGSTNRGVAANQIYQNNQANGGFGWGLAGNGQGNNGQNPTIIQANSPEQYQQFANLTEQVRSLNNRLGRFDSDNQQLVTELASMKQKLQVANDYNFQIKQQLADSAAQMQQLGLEKSAAEQQLANTQFQMEQLGRSSAEIQQQLANSQQSQFQQASTGGSNRFANATLRANNSLLQKLPQIQIPGVQARMDGDVIRVEIPTDQLFQTGSYQINAAHSHLLRNLSTAINQNFSKQIIGVEAHWDGTQIQPATTTHHQLTASQALSVFDFMTRLGLPKDQLFTMAMGSNRPRYPNGPDQNGISPNRRVEVVIYPETYDGS